MEVRDASAGYAPQVELPVVPEGYKQTEVGVIPEDWNLVILDALCERITKGTTPTTLGRRYVNSGVSFLKAEAISESGRVIRSKLAFIDPKTHELLSRSELKEGDLLISIAGVLGRVGSIDECILPANTNQALAVIRLSKRADVIPNFVLWCLRGEAVQARIRDISVQGAQANISLTDVRNFWLLLPQLPEQRAIGTALSDVDALLEALDRLIAKKRDIKQATMQQLLTAQTRLPGFEGEWDVRSLLEIADNQKSLFDDGDWVEAEHITDQGIRLVQTGNIGEGTFVEKATRKYINEASFHKLKCKELEEGDILICRLAEPAGRACILPDIGESRVITSVDVTIFRPRLEIADRGFLVQYFSTSDWFKKVLDNVGGTTHKRISRGALGKLKVPFPPVEEQKAIAKVLTDMDADLEALRERRTKTAALKQAMMQQLLTGRTRLV